MDASINLIKIEDLPGCADLREAWEVILLAKIQKIRIIQPFPYFFLENKNHFSLIIYVLSYSGRGNVKSGQNGCKSE